MTQPIWNSVVATTCEWDERSGTDVDVPMVEGGPRWLPDEKLEEWSTGEKEVEGEGQPDRGAAGGGPTGGGKAATFGQGRIAGITTSAMWLCQGPDEGPGWEDTDLVNSWVLQRFRTHSAMASPILSGEMSAVGVAAGASGTFTDSPPMFPSNEHLSYA